MRIVLDTSVLISALITKDTPPDYIYNLWCDHKFKLLCCNEQIDEFSRVITYPKLQKFISRYEAEQMLVGIKLKSKMIYDLPEVSYSPDPKDNYLISLAITGGADFIVSGDKRDLLSLKKVENIPIITVRKFYGMFLH